MSVVDVVASETLAWRVGQFRVRLVKQGDRYGLEDRLLWEKAEPAVEFYYVGDKDPASSFKGRGHFVSRYYYTSLRFRQSQVRGLCLDGGDPLRMSLTEVEMEQLMALIDVAVRGFADDEAVQSWRASWRVGR